MIAQEFSNSKDVTERTLAAQRADQNPLQAAWTCPDPVFSAWLVGMRLYDDGVPLCGCTGAHQRRGWLASEEAAALAQMADVPQYSIQ